MEDWADWATVVCSALETGYPNRKDRKGIQTSHVPRGEPPQSFSRNPPCVCICGDDQSDRILCIIREPYALWRIRSLPYGRVHHSASAQHRDISRHCSDELRVPKEEPFLPFWAKDVQNRANLASRVLACGILDFSSYEAYFFSQICGQLGLIQKD